jgi:hypothetical protein
MRKWCSIIQHYLPGYQNASPSFVGIILCTRVLSELLNWKDAEKHQQNCESEKSAFHHITHAEKIIFPYAGE